MDRKWLLVIVLMGIAVAYFIIIIQPRAPVCGDGFCAAAESLASCPRDCTPKEKGNVTRIPENARRSMPKLFRNGDVNADGRLNNSDLLVFETARAEVEENGYLRNETLLQRLDIDGDGSLTEDDLNCFVEIIDELYPSLGGCPPCEPEAMEICNDGLDNNCDGQTDRETYSGRSYAKDLCACNELTPCEMVYDLDGLTGLQEGEKVMRCISMGSGYDWMDEEQTVCDASSEGSNLACGEENYTCLNATGFWIWWNPDYGSFSF